MNVPVAGSTAVSVRQHTVGQSTPWPCRMRGRRRTDKLVIHPAAPDSGVRFACHDSTQTIKTFPARWASVVETRGGTVLGDGLGATLRGAIPLLAALRVAGVDNALVEVHGPRIPADIGDFHNYLELLADARMQAQPAARQVLRVTERIEVRDRYGFAVLSPAADFRISVSISPTRPAESTEIEYGWLVSSLAEPLSGTRALAAGFRPMLHKRDGDTVVARPLQEITLLPEALKIRLIEMIGHLSLAGPHVAGSIHAQEPSESICQTLVGTMLERHVIEGTTVEVLRAAMPAAAASSAAPATRPTGDSGAGTVSATSMGQPPKPASDAE